MDRKHGLLLVFATAIISGFSIFINKFSLAAIDSSVFTFIKNVVVALFLFGIILFAKKFNSLKQLHKNNWLQLILIGLIGGSIPFLLFFKGLSLTSAASGAFIHKTLFIYASIFALVFLNEKINFKFYIGALLLLIGNLLLLKINSFSFGLGESLILLATLFWAGENVLSKYVLKDVSGNIVAFGRMFFGSLFILMFLAFTNKLPIIATLPSSALLWIIITSSLLLLFVTTYYNGLKYVKVSTATSILLLGSPITTLLSFSFLDAPLALGQFVGIVLLGAGTYIIVQFVEFTKAQSHTHSES